MKKKLPLLFVATILIVGTMFVLQRNKQGMTSPEQIAAKLSTFEKASVSERVLTDTLANICPQTFLFLGLLRDDVGVIIMNSLPKTIQDFNPVYFQMSHCNLTFLQKNDQVYGLVPQGAFGKNVDLFTLLQAGGFQANLAKDLGLVTIPLGKVEQYSLSLPLLDHLNPEKLEGSPCTVRTINCYENTASPYLYIMHGVLHRLTENEKKYMNIYANSTSGAKGDQTLGEDFYVVRVPDTFSEKILGMAGGSVTVTIDKKEYFFGVNTLRIRTGTSTGNDTSWVTMMGIQPIKNDDIE